MRDIKTITEAEAKELFEFVYPKDKYSRYHFDKTNFEPIITEHGERVSFDMRSLIGIFYHNGQDNCILHFDNTRAVLWLYNHGFDISKQLEINSFMSEMENDFEMLEFEISHLRTKRDRYPDKYKEITLEHVMKELKRIEENYLFKDYN